MTIQFGFPFSIGADGRTASVALEDHVRDLIEQVLFTQPGERVNRPTFGSGLLQAVFAPNSDELAATLQFLAQTSLQQWLGDIIDLKQIEIHTDDATLHVTVQYVLKLTAAPQQAQFKRTV
jgi:phage baseplate assembly protein W